MRHAQAIQDDCTLGERTDPDDAPPLTRAIPDHATFFDGDRFVRNGTGRPKPASPKDQISKRPAMRGGTVVEPAKTNRRATTPEPGHAHRRPILEAPFRSTGQEIFLVFSFMFA